MGTPQLGPALRAPGVASRLQAIRLARRAPRARPRKRGWPAATFFFHGKSKVFTILKQQTYDKIVGDSINLWVIPRTFDKIVGDSKNFRHKE